MSAPLFEFHEGFAEPQTSGLYAVLGKRLFDITLVLLIAPLVLSFLATILAALSVSGGAPLYSQLRVGREGRLFRCWKIRTMIPDADAALQGILRKNPELAREWGETQKLERDPRVTAFGAVLRRSSLDELPQLWNVLCGHMSLVGPRPFLPEQAPLYLGGRRDADYYRVTPGLTGLWQVSRRNRGSFAERAIYDAEYCQAICLWADLMILIRTIAVVIRATGV